MSKINWFPGHMKKTYDTLEKNKKNFDFIIQVLDARAISFSSNTELLNFFKDKKILNVALKKDIADVKENGDILVFGKDDGKLKEKIIKKINTIFKTGINFYYPIHTGIVIGLPNIGKSTLINKLSNTKKVIVMDKPGTTKNVSLQKISNDIFLYDSPGLMYKKIDDLVTGYVLCLIGTINIKVVSLFELMHFALKFLKRYYSSLYEKLFDKTIDNYDDELLFLCKKWNLFLKNNEPNYELVLSKLYNLFQTGQIGKISFDNKDLSSLLSQD